MRFLRRHSFWRSVRRRLNAGLTLLAYVLTAFGVPLPASPAGAAACGCVSEEHCQSGGCCCSKKAPAKQRPTSCCTGRPGCKKACCHDKPSDSSGQQAQSQSDPDDATPTGAVRWVIGITAMQCRGHSTTWVSAGVVLPAPAPLAALSIPQPTSRLAYADEIAVAADRVPPVPPPRPVQA